MNIQKRGNFTRVEDFVKPSVVNTNHEYTFDVKTAPELLLKAILEGQHITIVGDYDCDGICGTAIFYRGLKRLQELLTNYKDDSARAKMSPAIIEHLVKLTQRAYQCDEAQAHDILCNHNKAELAVIRVRLPHRYSEGYGMKDFMVDEINSGVLLTVDNGIAAASAMQKAMDKG